MQQVEEVFWSQLHSIQEEVVRQYLNQFERGEPADLYGVTYDTIYSLLELIDGYRESYRLGISLVDKESGEIINPDRFLHDQCEQYLRYQNKIP